MPAYLVEIWRSFWDLHSGHGGEQRLPDVMAYVDSVLDPASRAERNYLVQTLWGMTQEWRQAPTNAIEDPTDGS